VCSVAFLLKPLHPLFLFFKVVVVVTAEVPSTIVVVKVVVDFRV
jgi:hypothetical protein